MSVVMMVMAVVVMVMPVMVVMMMGQHDAAVTMSVEQVVVMMADNPRAVMMVMMKRPGLARSRTANDERERSHCRKQRFPEHKFLRLMMFGRRSSISPGYTHQPTRSLRAPM